MGHFARRFPVPVHRSRGGGVVFFDLVTLRLLTWHFPIPISTDNSFQAETYVSWVVLSSMVAGVSLGHGYGRLYRSQVSHLL